MISNLSKKKAEKILVGTEETCSSLTLFAELSDEAVNKLSNCSCDCMTGQISSKNNCCLSLGRIRLEVSKCQFSSLV